MHTFFAFASNQPLTSSRPLESRKDVCCALWKEMEMGIHKREMHNPFRAREASGRNEPRQEPRCGGCITSRDVCRSPNLD